jgi:hypothetical protein
VHLPWGANMRIGQLAVAVAVLGAFGISSLASPRPKKASSNFQALDASTVVDLRTDNTLWLGRAPFPDANRKQIDGNVQAYQALDASTIVVLGIGGNLFLEHGPFTTHFASRELINTPVQSFQAIDASTIVSLRTDNTLWLGPDKQIDGNVQAYQALDASTIVVLGIGGNLFLEHGPFTTHFASRELIDSPVASGVPALPVVPQQQKMHDWYTVARYTSTTDGSAKTVPFDFILPEGSTADDACRAAIPGVQKLPDCNGQVTCQAFDHGVVASPAH